MDNSEKDWDIIFNDVENIAKQYFNADINNLYKKNISIEFKLAKYEGRLKAFSRIINEESYEVTLSRGMLVNLMNIATKYAEDEKFIELVNPLKNKVFEIRNFLFYFYVDLIICHEWAHIFCGHLKLPNINQHDFSEVFESGHSLEKTMELEADSKAATLILARLANNHIKLNKTIYGSLPVANYESKKSWEITVYAILSLFYYYENKLSDKNKTHPKPSFRAFTSLIFITGELADKPNIRSKLPYISNDKNEIYSYFANLAVNFHTNYKNVDLESVITKQIEAFKYCSEIGKNIEKTDLNKYREIKGSRE